MSSMILNLFFVNYIGSGVINSPVPDVINSTDPGVINSTEPGVMNCIETDVIYSTNTLMKMKLVSNYLTHLIPIFYVTPPVQTVVLLMVL